MKLKSTHRHRVRGASINIDCLYLYVLRGPLHTRDWEPVTSTLQALSLVEKAEPVQVYFTLRLRDQWSIYVNARWVSSLHGILYGIEWIMFHGHLDYFKKPPLGGRPNTKPEEHGTLNVHNYWFILFYHACITLFRSITILCGNDNNNNSNNNNNLHSRFNSYDKWEDLYMWHVTQWKK